MAKRTHAEKPASRREEVQEPTETTNSLGGLATKATDEGEKLKAELDALLDEIDGVLETNADEFVKSYIQKGGE